MDEKEKFNPVVVEKRARGARAAQRYRIKTKNNIEVIKKENEMLRRENDRLKKENEGHRQELALRDALLVQANKQMQNQVRHTEQVLRGALCQIVGNKEPTTPSTQGPSFSHGAMDSLDDASLLAMIDEIPFDSSLVASYSQSQCLEGSIIPWDQ